MLVTLDLNEWTQGVLLCVDTGQITSSSIDSLDRWLSAGVRWDCWVCVSLYLQEGQAVTSWKLCQATGSPAMLLQKHCPLAQHGQAKLLKNVIWYVLMWKWCSSSFVPAFILEKLPRFCMKQLNIQEGQERGHSKNLLTFVIWFKRYLYCADILVNDVRICYQKSRPLDKYPGPSPKSMNMQWEML